jgi:hypothetical protein
MIWLSILSRRWYRRSHASLQIHSKQLRRKKMRKSLLKNFKKILPLNGKGGVLKERQGKRKLFLRPMFLRGLL